MVLAPEINSKDIKTVEGLAKGDTLHPLQEAFINEGALQCGFCTPGLLMSIERLLSNKSNPSEQEIRSAIAGNICRCTGYDKIIKAVQSLALRKEE
jgi:carbon-monoxide dehydrogenase small subunit